MLIKSEYFFNIDYNFFFFFKLLFFFPVRHLWPVCFVHPLPIGEQWDQNNNESKNVRFPFLMVHSRAVLNESLVHEVSSDLVTRNGIRFLTQTPCLIFSPFLMSV